MCSWLSPRECHHGPVTPRLAIVPKSNWGQGAAGQPGALRNESLFVLVRRPRSRPRSGKRRSSTTDEHEGRGRGRAAQTGGQYHVGLRSTIGPLPRSYPTQIDTFHFGSGSIAPSMKCTEKIAAEVASSVGHDPSVVSSIEHLLPSEDGDFQPQK